jgi:hypothetical protein
MAINVLLGEVCEVGQGGFAALDGQPAFAALGF